MQHKHLINFTVARAHALASKDAIHKCGAVVVNSDTYETLATGYNGPPAKFDDNSILFDKTPFRSSVVYPESELYGEHDWITKKHFMLHAEDNALSAAKKYNAANTALYCTHVTCPSCLMKAVKESVGRIYLEARFVNSFPKHRAVLEYILAHVKYPLQVLITPTRFVDHQEDPVFVHLASFLGFIREFDLPLNKYMEALDNLLLKNDFPYNKDNRLMMTKSS